MRRSPSLLIPVMVAIALASCAAPTPDDASNSPKSTTTFSSPLDMADKAGIDLYPGAAIPNDKSNVTEDDREIHYTVIMTTSDSADKVLKFYATKVQNADANVGRVMGFGKNGSSVMVTATTNQGKTEIKVVSVVEKKTK